MRNFKIGQLAELSGLSERSIRYYEEQGLITSKRTKGGQRIYVDSDLVYLKRIQELKSLGFSLIEIKRIFELKSEDKDGSKRREELLSSYKKKLEEDLIKFNKLKAHLDELEWHIHQLEKADNAFQDCPGSLCASCEYKDKCTFFNTSIK